MSAPFCVHCTTGYEIPGEPKGNIQKIGPYDTYVASPSNGAATSDRAVYFAYDAFGLALRNNKIIPDLLADRLGVQVLVPDIFRGAAVSPGALSMPSTAEAVRSQSLFTKVTSTLGMLKVVPWFISNRPATKIKDLEAWIKAAEEERGVKSWGAVGYCYGAKPALHFNGQGKLKASVLCHPSFVAVDDVRGIKAPTLFLCAEEDPIFTESLRKQSEQILKERTDVRSEFKMYPNTVHGFAARPDLSVPEVKKAFEDALEQTVAWFAQYLVD